ncbi:MAG: arginyltransferase [Kiloniellaceae bacterium]
MRQGPNPAGVRIFEGTVGLGLPRQAFYVLTDTPCPYLPGRRERKLITEIDGPEPAHHYSLLSRAGFRRSHHFAYRPACAGCTACVPVRVPVRDFGMSRSQKRVWQANADLRPREGPPRATAEQYELFARYISSRHGDGEMAAMTFADYRGMVEHSRIDTRIAEFRDREARLVAACLVDWLEDGPSAVYSFFDPELSRRSLGTYMILWLIEAALARRLPYAYLGYWIGESPKMAYKIRFRPLEAFGADGWEVMAGD